MKKPLISFGHLVVLFFWVQSLVAQSPSPALGNYPIFPADNVWKWDISNYKVHSRSNAYIQSIGTSKTAHADFGTVWEGAPIGIPFVVMDKNQSKVPIHYTDYGDESDQGPFPIPLSAPIEGGASADGDRHVIVIDTFSHKLYELYHAFPQASQWNASSGVEWNLLINDSHPLGFTSADAAGLPILPGLVRYDEVMIKKEINHAIRMTVSHSQKAYIYPATHYASDSTDANLPPMGLRLRLKASVDTTNFSAPARVILRALKKHGALIADNGSDWYFSGVPDSRWDDDALSDLKRLRGSDFEVIETVDKDGKPILSLQAPFTLKSRESHTAQFSLFHPLYTSTSYTQGIHTCRSTSTKNQIYLCDSKSLQLWNMTGTVIK